MILFEGVRYEATPHIGPNYMGMDPGSSPHKNSSKLNAILTYFYMRVSGVISPVFSIFSRVIHMSLKKSYNLCASFKVFGLRQRHGNFSDIPP